MPISDLLHALPGVLLWGLAPGILLATALAPRWGWSLRLAAAPGLACGSLGILGLLTHVIGISFSVPSALVFLLLLVGLAWWCRRTAATLAADPAEPQSTTLGRWLFIGSTVVAGACSALALVIGLHDHLLPVWNDPAFHATLARSIQTTGNAIPDAGSRAQMGFHATAALIASVTNTVPATVLLPLTLLSVALLPLGAGCLARELTGSHLAGAAAAIASLGFGLPSFIIGFGDFPLVVDSVLVIPAVIGTWRWLSDADRGGLALAIASAACIWVIHGTEAFTVVVLAGPLALWLLASGPFRQRLIRLAILGCCAAAVALVCNQLSRLNLAAAAAAPLPPPTGTPVSATEPLGRLPVRDIVVSFLRVTLLDPLTFVLYGCGLAWAILHPRLRWLAAAQLISLLILIDRDCTHLLAWVWAQTSVWSEADRLISMQWFFVPVIMGGAALLVGRVLSQARVPRPLRRWGPALAVLVVAPLLVLGMQRDLDRYSAYASTHDVVSAADLHVIAALATKLPAGSLILNNGEDDAGKWIPALTSDQIALPKGIAGGYPQEPHAVALQHACTDPAAAVAALADVSAVFVGDRLDSAAVHPWTLACIRALPNLTEVTSEQSSFGTAAAFVVKR